MSEELRDEVEAINSIYGDGCLSPADDHHLDDEPSAVPPASGNGSGCYILQLPGDEASSLRLSFPFTYPSEPLTVLGTHHSSGGRKGAGARDLRLFREAVGVVFRPGEVCLFDAVEEFMRLSQEEEEALQHHEEEEEGVKEGAGGDERGERAMIEDQADFAAMAPPPWTLSEVVVESKSTFIAHVAPVTSISQAKLYLNHLLWSDKRIRTATHNISAWRIRGPAGDNSSSSSNAPRTSFQDCDDDGETAAGGRLLHLMQVMEVWDAMVVVTRWYGGVKLGPRRFALINGVARDGFVRAGMVEVAGGAGAGASGGKERKKGR